MSSEPRTMTARGAIVVSEFRRLLEGDRRVYYAERVRLAGLPGWDVISRHRKRQTALAACQRHCRGRRAESQESCPSTLDSQPSTQRSSHGRR